MAHGLYISPTEFVAFADPRRPLMRTIASRERSPAGILGFTQWLPNPGVISASTVNCGLNH
nr:Terminase-like family protein [Candidatus Pantoea persica]